MSTSHYDRRPLPRTPLRSFFAAALLGLATLSPALAADEEATL